MHDQNDCVVAMGSPLASIIANLFMRVNKKNGIQNYCWQGPLYYRQYVDDIFAVFQNEPDAMNFFLYLNRDNIRIQLLKKEINIKLYFLHILKDNTDKRSTSVYHKPTYNGLLTNHFSFIPESYKIVLIRTLINRTFKLNNTWNLFTYPQK